MNRLIIYVFVIFVLSSCSNNHNEKLDDVYYLINDNKIEHAVAKFETIPFASMKTEADKAFYKLIKVRLDYVQYIPITSDTVIDYSLDYYRKSGDKAKEAECLFYKSQIFDEYQDNEKEAIAYLKQAETIVDGIEDMDIKHRVYEALAAMNNRAGIENLALIYAQKNLKVSQEANNPDWLAYAYSFFEQIYREKGQEEKALMFRQKSLSYINGVEDRNKSAFYNGMAFQAIGVDNDKAREYAMKTLNTNEADFGYGILARVALLENNPRQADSLYHKALAMTKSMQYKLVLLHSLMDMYAGLDDYKKALDMHLEYCKVKDLIFQKRKKEGIQHRQMEYDYQLKELEMRQHIMYCFFGIVVICLLVAIASVFVKYRYNKVQKQVLEYQKMVDGYTSRIKALENEISNARQTETESMEQQKRINDMQRRVDELKGRQAEILRCGKQRYDDIMEHNGTTVRWNKRDFVHFLEYYRIVDISFMHYLETEYDHLSPKYCFFEIMQNIGKSDDDIMRILGIGESTMRSTRSRIKSKYIGKYTLERKI